jgi:hypothetical protein
LASFRKSLVAKLRRRASSVVKYTYALGHFVAQPGSNNYSISISATVEVLPAFTVRPLAGSIAYFCFV